jgi:20S proteasome alpha/beta subunit
MQKMSLEDAKKLALSALKETMEEKISRSNVEMMVIAADRQLVERVSTEDIKRYLEKLQ